MKYLVLGPSGMGIYGILGNLKSIEERLDLFQEISGSSSGSIIAFMLGVGLSIDEISNRLLDIDTTRLSKSISLRNILNMYGGVCPGISKQILEELGGCNPTFSELKIKIHVSSYNLKRSQTEYFSSDTHPNMKVIDAVYRSCSIPFVFGCLDMYVDGGLCERLPLVPFLQHKNEDVYIIETCATTEPDINDFISFASCITRNIILNRVDYPQYTQRIRIPLTVSQVAEFDMSQEDKLKLYIKGFKENIIYL